MGRGRGRRVRRKGIARERHDFVHWPGIGRVCGENVTEHLIDGFLKHRVNVVWYYATMDSTLLAVT